MNPGDEIRAEFGDHTFTVFAEKREDGMVGPPATITHDEISMKLFGYVEGLATYKSA